jgi:hypothetical protein
LTWGNGRLLAETTQQTVAAAPSDPYDLGDTELYPSYEVAPFTKNAAGRPIDPETGRYVKVDLQPAPSANEPEESTTPPAQASSHPDSLVKQALELGWDQEDIDATPTQALTNAVIRDLRDLKNASEQANLQRTLEQPASPSPPTQEPSAGGPTTADGDWAPSPEDIDRIDEGIINLFKKQAARISKLEQRLAQAEQVMGNVTGFLERRENESRVQHIDRMFEHINNPARYGKGSGLKLSDQSAEFRRRIATVEHAKRMTGSTKPSDREWITKIPEADTELFGDSEPAKPPPGKNGKLSQRQQEWLDAGTAVPTNRLETSLPPGEEKAKKNIAEKQRDQGIVPESSSLEDQEIKDTLLS